MTLRRTLLAIPCALALSLLLPACGGDDDGAATSGGSGGAGAGSTSTSSAGGGGSTSSGGGGGGAGGSGSGSTIGELLPQALFEEIFLHRGTAPCPGAFYTYDAFLAAAEAFPAFAAEGPDDVRRREVAAFLANIAHETTGGWATAPDGPYSWGLCWITEGGTVDPSALPDYCSPSQEWPCAPGKKYFGRGPMQLSWNYNYGQCGQALGIDLLSDPDQVATDPSIAFRAALWFWMTPQAPKPSCHDVMTGQWAPTPADTAAGRVPGFGLTINIINGGIECGYPSPPQVLDRLGFYDRFTQILGTTPEDNLDCQAMQPY